MYKSFIMSILLTLSLQAAGVPLHLAEDGMAVVKGERAFILGLYENPADEVLLQEVAEAGFNLVRVPKPTPEALDRLEEAGLWAWINTGSAIDLSTAETTREAALSEMANSFANHPAFLVWEVPDEALWNVWYRAMGWRHQAEPEQLGARIRELADGDMRRELLVQLDKVRSLRTAGRFEDAENLADQLWRRLGETPPRPELRISNAAERAQTLREGMLQGYRKLKELDPAHPVWMNHAPRNQIAQLAAFNEAADIVGCDIYPVPRSRHLHHSDLSDQTMSSVGEYTRRMQEAAPEKPVWMVLQGFAWGDLQKNETAEIREELRVPTFEESRFMAYDAIVNGARGLLYWGTHVTDKNGPLWKNLLRLVRELGDRAELLSTPEIDGPLHISYLETWGSVDKGVLALAKRIGDDVALLVVNEWHEPLTYRISGLEGYEGVTLSSEQDGVAVTVRDGAITAPIPGHGVQWLR